MAKMIADHNLSSLGFRAWRGRPSLMAGAHTHGDLEANCVLTGELRYFFGGRFETIGAGRLALFWGGIPHQLVGISPGTTVVWLTLPLAWFLQWRVAERFRRRLLEGEFVRDTAAGDAALCGRWAADFAAETAELREIVLLEAEARVRRLALASGGAAGRSRPASGVIERVTRFIGERYATELTIAEIATAAKLHPNYLMRAFKRQCGMSLWDYVLRLRISHAQRLLATTDRKIVDVALAAGFGSASRFYATFQRVCGVTPRAYRAAVRG